MMKNIIQNRRRNTARKTLQKCSSRIVAVSFFFVPLLMLFSAKTFAQPFVVKGNISTRTAAVRYASVTFVNTSDTKSNYLR